MPHKKSLTNKDALDPVVEVTQEEDSALFANLQTSLLQLVVVLGHGLCQVPLLHTHTTKHNASPELVVNSLPAKQTHNQT